VPKGGPPAPATAGAASSAVDGRVDLDPKLAGRAAPGDTVFIFARDPDGSRMPLAAIRLTVGELPKTFSLNDSMAMAPTATISAAKRIVIEARISKSGQATAQTGDLAGLSAPVAPGARDVRVLIDRVLP
jgi:cytochrome c-type biogenesis protein CcmH